MLDAGEAVLARAGVSGARVLAQYVWAAMLGAQTRPAHRPPIDPERLAKARAERANGVPAHKVIRKYRLRGSVAQSLRNESP